VNITQAPLRVCTLTTGEKGFEATIRFPMALPSKKNNLVRRAHAKGNLVYNPETKAAKDAAETLARAQWGRDPVVHPEVYVSMAIANIAKDPDGIWTTVADALKKGGVLRDDSIRFFNGRKVFEPVTIVGDREECVTVVLRFEQTNALVREYVRQEEHRRA